MKKISESSIQQSCFLWLNNNYGLKHHSPRLKMFSVPNELAMILGAILKSYRIPDSIVDKSVSQVLDKMKSTGMTAGVSDSIVILPNKTIYVEFKTDIGRQSDKQKEFQKIVADLGHEYYIVRSIEQFKEIINENLRQ